MDDQADPNVLQSLFNFFSSPGGTSLLTGAAGGLLTNKAYDRLSDVGKDAERDALKYAERGQEESSFKPFTVTTPTGSMFRSQIGPMTQPPVGIMPPNRPFYTNGWRELNGKMEEEMRRLNPGLFGQPVTDGPTAVPRFDTELNQMPGAVMDGVGVFGSGQGLERTDFTKGGLKALEMGVTNRLDAVPSLSEHRYIDHDKFLSGARLQPMPFVGTLTPEEFQNLNPEDRARYQSFMQNRLPQPVTGGPVAPPAGMPRFAGGPDSQPAADAMARQNFMQNGLPQPGPQSQEGVNVEMSLSPAEQAMYQGLFGGAGNFFGQAQQSTAGREQDIFNRIRDAQRPEEERQNLALEQRLAAQGRLGVRTADFGGTPEQLAMSKAQSEARNTAMLGAMQQAQAEQAQQAALGQQFLGASYLPQAQMLNALQPGLAQQQMAQQAQQFGTGLFSETAMSGLEARLIAEQARANLLGGVGSNILSGLMSPQFNKAGNVTSPGGLTGSVDAIKELLEGLGIKLGKDD